MSNQNPAYCSALKLVQTTLLLLIPIAVSSQVSHTTVSHQTQLLAALESEKVSLNTKLSSMSSSASTWFDVTYYCLHLDIHPENSHITGNVKISGVCRISTSGPLVLDLMNHLQVDSIFVDGQAASFWQEISSLHTNLGRTDNSGDTLSLVVFYHGDPSPTGFGSFEFSYHQGEPWIWTLSEPYGAKDWWPCKDDPSDKADSADIYVTCDSTLKAGSEGVLVSLVNDGNGRSTSHWHEQYPIASYLISIAVANYEQFIDWFHYSGTDSMEVLNYILPEHFSAAKNALTHEVDMLSIYSAMYGMYPFVKEKYGHAEFGWGGAMEHQTMASTTTFNEDVISHELAHQWFGDMITCRTWADLWLNEGFAQYSSAIFREREYGEKSYWDYMNRQMSLATAATGEIGIADTSTVRNLFDPARIYSKGATVLHMLRHVLGDSVFFRCVRSYASQPGLRYSTASIQDFATVCESVSGRNLSWFFREWIYGEGFPEYYYSWNSKQSGAGYATTLTLQQESRNGNPPYFTMPIDIRLRGNNWDSVVTVYNDSLRQQFTFSLPVRLSALSLDPSGWILKEAFDNSAIPPAQYSLDQNYPNPFNPTTTVRVRIEVKSLVTLEIFDVLGRRIQTLMNGEMPAGSFSFDWNASTMPSGIYFCRLSARPDIGEQVGTFQKTIKMLVEK